MSEDRNIEALLEERRGYVLHGKDDRVKQVDADLKRRGYKVAAATKRKGQDEKSAPEGRESRSDKQSTANAAPKSEG